MEATSSATRHDDVIKLIHFPRYWPFVRGIHRSTANSPQRPVTRSFDVFFDLHLNKWLGKQPWGWWFETPSCPLCRHCNGWACEGPWSLMNVQYNHSMYFCERNISYILWYLCTIPVLWLDEYYMLDDTIWYDMILYDKKWYDTKRSGTMKYTIMLYDMI